MSPFNASDWISCGKHWNSVPPTVHRAAKQVFAIPQSLHDRLFGWSNLDLHGLISTHIPSSFPEQDTTQSREDSLSHYFSADLPHKETSMSLTQLSRLPMPADKTVHQLVHYAWQAWLDGKQSVRYAHLSDGATVTLFPLVIISVWEEYVRMKKAHVHWVQSNRWLSKLLKDHKHPERQTLAREASFVLHSLPWDTEQNLSDNKPVHDLYRLLGNTWLASSQLDTILQFLEERIQADWSLLDTVRIESVEFSNILLCEYRARNKQTSMHAWLTSASKDLASGKQLLTIANLGQVNNTPHWTAVVIDRQGEAPSILYGDPFGEEMPRELLSAYQWLVQLRNISKDSSDTHGDSENGQDSVQGNYLLPISQMDLTAEFWHLMLWSIMCYLCL